MKGRKNYFGWQVCAHRWLAVLLEGRLNISERQERMWVEQVACTSMDKKQKKDTIVTFHRQRSHSPVALFLELDPTP